MAYDSRARRHELFLAAATLAAHAGNYTPGFRQRDVRFIVELFSNWVDPSAEGNFLEMQNTQVSRYLRGLIEDGYSRQVSRSGAPRYRLTRTGLLELVSRVVNTGEFMRREHFLFLYYFVANYSPKLRELVQAEGANFPYSLKLELDSLLDSGNLLQAEIDRANKELKRLENRIDSAYKASKIMREGLRTGTAVKDLIKELERKYPYELNSQKPLSELMESINPAHRVWELSEGQLKRAEQIWTPAREILKRYLELLKRLKNSDVNESGNNC